MRIIAGTARSLPLKAPEGMDTRPTTDRIKETLFNIIQDEVPGAYFAYFVIACQFLHPSEKDRGRET